MTSGAVYLTHHAAKHITVQVCLVVSFSGHRPLQDVLPCDWRIRYLYVCAGEQVYLIKSGYVHTI